MDNSAQKYEFKEYFIKSRNPCFSGSSNHTEIYICIEDKDKGRNPCFSGSSNHTEKYDAEVLKNKGRNPCFSGSSNHTYSLVFEKSHEGLSQSLF